MIEPHIGFGGLGGDLAGFERFFAWDGGRQIKFVKVLGQDASIVVGLWLRKAVG